MESAYSTLYILKFQSHPVLSISHREQPFEYGVYKLFSPAGQPQKKPVPGHCKRSCAFCLNLPSLQPYHAPPSHTPKGPGFLLFPVGVFSLISGFQPLNLIEITGELYKSQWLGATSRDIDLVDLENGLVSKFFSSFLGDSWRRAWQSIPAFLPGESPGQRSLAGDSPWVTESNITEAT